MNQHEFHQLLEKYLEGQCTPEEEKIVVAWHDQMAKPSREVLPPAEKEETRLRIWKKVKARANSRAQIVRLWPYFAAAAACLVLTIWIGAFANRSTTGSEPSAAAEMPVIDIRNTSAKPQEVTLEDGSVVVLEPGSLFSYPEHFGTRNRTVYLTGEARFDIQRNHTKPFLVHAGDIVTEVLGTSFIVRSDNRLKTTEVSVLSGKVSVYENIPQADKTRNGIILTPNQKATYRADTKQLISGIVDEPVTLSAADEKIDFTFEDTRLPAVLALLKKRYALDFILENDALRHCAVTADLNDLPLFTQLELICSAIGARYETRGADIFINGKGCQEF
jgi:transmembrane sensor